MATTAVRTPRTVGVEDTIPKKATQALAAVSNQGVALPNRWAFHGPPGIGKTSLLAYAQRPIFLMSRGETGLLTLIDSGQLPPTSHFPEVVDWTEFLDCIKALRTEEHQYRTLIIDTANGAERMMHEFVCQRDFGGDWGEHGFAGYQRGYEIALADWRMFLNLLDQLRKEKMMTIFLLLHTRIRTFRNPAGPDYDRYVPELHEKTWGLTKGWLDNICFANFEVLVKTGTKVTVDASKKGKAAETTERILYTSSDNPTFDAKNRLGLPPEIELGESAEEGWKALSDAIRATRKKEPEPAKKEAANVA